MLVFVLGIAATAFVLGAFNSNALKIERDNKTAAILVEAKTGLIGWSLQQGTKPGALPCPDTNNDGSADTSGSNACSAYIGRLPWKQLGISMLKDADGECLWYALSPIWRNQMTTTTRSANPINSSKSGTISIVDNTGSALSANVNPVIAVIIAPGSPVSGQSRSGTSTTYCAGDSNSNASSYLDSKNSINNATGNVSGNNYTFILGNTDASFNDRIIYITTKEFYSSIRKRMVAELLGNLDVHAGPAEYFDTNSSYPCPAPTITGNANCAYSTGFIPYNDTAIDLQYASLGDWLTRNGWFGLATYDYYSPTHVKVTITDSNGSYSCDANSNVFTCS